MHPRKGKKVVVIGSGIGGSASALLLANAGFDVTLFEKNRRIGGSLSSYDKQGFKVDIGTHMFCRGNKGPLGEVLRKVNKPGLIPFIRTHDIAELRFGTFEDPIKSLRKISVPSSPARLPKFILDLIITAKLSPLEYLKAAALFSFVLSMPDHKIEDWDHKTVEDLVLKFTNNPLTIGLFGFLLGLYFVIPYWQVSAGEAIWAFKKMFWDNSLSYPKGGAISIPESYLSLAKIKGAKVFSGQGVKKICIKNGQVSGVYLANGNFINADFVISSSSLRTTLKYLVGEEHFPIDYRNKINNLKGSFIAVQAKVGLKKKLVNAGALVGGIGFKKDLLKLNTQDISNLFNQLEQGEIPQVIPFYCPIPTNFDPSLAPPGCQILTACAVAPTSNINLKDPSKSWQQVLLNCLKEIVPNLEKEALFIDLFSVDFIEKWIGKEYGPAISTAQTPGQVGKNRPSVVSPIPGLFFAGCCAGGRGVGTELAAASAMECVEKLMESQNS